MTSTARNTHDSYYFDVPADDELVLSLNFIDDEREGSGDPFDIVAQREEEMGCQLAAH
jgi:hypothetical protein